MQLTDDTTSLRVRERSFVVSVTGRPAPATLWTPEDADGPRPVVLLGHGAGLHRRSPYLTGFARRLVRHHAFAVLSMDWHNHGGRRPDGGLDFDAVMADRQRERANPRPGITDEMVADYRAVLDAARSLPEVGEGPAGYWGMSLGTVHGIPLAAAEPRIRAAVFGTLGVSPVPTTDPWQAFAQHRIGGDARRVNCPVLFLMQGDDELYPRSHALTLFDLFGTPDRVLHLNPGAHSAIPRHEYDFSEAWLAEKLRA